MSDCDQQLVWELRDGLVELQLAIANLIAKIDDTVPF